MRAALRGVIASIALLALASSLRAWRWRNRPPDPQQPAYTPSELVNAGHRLFGGVSGALASVIEHAVSKWALPNG